jgi:iron complex outermembrane receptor protein
LNTLVEQVSVPSAPPPFTNANFVSGNLLGFPSTYVPQFQETLTATYTLPVRDTLGQISVAATFNYTDEYYVQTIPLGGKVPSVALLNLNLNWDSIGGSPVDLSIFATNATNTHYYTFTNNQNVGFIMKNLGEPAMFGARLKYRFGADAS